MLQASGNIGRQSHNPMLMSSIGTLSNIKEMPAEDHNNNASNARNVHSSASLVYKNAPRVANATSTV